MIVTLLPPGKPRGRRLEGPGRWLRGRAARAAPRLRPYKGFKSAQPFGMWRGPGGGAGTPALLADSGGGRGAEPGRQVPGGEACTFEFLGPSKCEFWVPIRWAGSLDPPKRVSKRGVAVYPDPWVRLADASRPAAGNCTVLESSPERVATPPSTSRKAGLPATAGPPGPPPASPDPLGGSWDRPRRQRAGHSQLSLPWKVS